MASNHGSMDTNELNNLGQCWVTFDKFLPRWWILFSRALTFLLWFYNISRDHVQGGMAIDKILQYFIHQFYFNGCQVFCIFWNIELLSWDVIKLSEIIIIIITIILFSSSSFSLFSFLPLFHLPPPHLPSLPLLIFLFLLLSKFRNLRALSTTYCGLSNASSIINPYSLTGKIKLFCQTCVNSPLIISCFSFPCFCFFLRALCTSVIRLSRIL